MGLSRGCIGIFEVVANEGDCVCGAFFHEPVAGVGHDSFSHVNGDVSHDDGLGCAKGFASADGEYGHGEFGLLKDFVVFHILREGFEVSEARAHGAGFGVLGGVELSRRFVGLCGTGAEVIPDAVEIDALAALHETLFLRTPEGEVPELVVFYDVVPGGDARQRSVHDDQTLDLIGVERGVGVSDHDADVVRDDKGAVKAEGGDDSANVGGLCLLVVAAGGAGGAADAAEIGHDDGVAFFELGGERRPGVAGFGIAVNEDDDRALTCGANEDIGAGRTMDDLRFEG